MTTPIEIVKEKSMFEARLAQLIYFIEEEAKRIDEEKKGAYRRDGGRKFQCHQFLKEMDKHLILPILTSIEGEIEKGKCNERKIKDFGEYTAETYLEKQLVNASKSEDIEIIKKVIETLK